MEEQENGALTQEQAFLSGRVSPIGRMTVHCMSWNFCAEQDSVRLLAVEGCGHFARLLKREDSIASILPVVQRFALVYYLLPLL